VRLVARAIPIAQDERAEEVQVAAVVVHDALVVAADRARLDHRDRLVLVHALPQRRQSAGLQHDIVVEEQDALVAGGLGTDVAGVTRPTIEARVNQPDLRVALLYDLAGGIIRVVVDDNDLGRRRILSQQGIKTLRQVILPVPIDYDRTDHERARHGSDEYCRCPQFK
jgi:hypothetical protein